MNETKMELETLKMKRSYEVMALGNSITNITQQRDRLIEIINQNKMIYEDKHARQTQLIASRNEMITNLQASLTHEKEETAWLRKTLEERSSDLSFIATQLEGLKQEKQRREECAICNDPTVRLWITCQVCKKSWHLSCTKLFRKCHFCNLPLSQSQIDQTRLDMKQGHELAHRIRSGNWESIQVAQQLELPPFASLEGESTDIDTGDEQDQNEETQQAIANAFPSSPTITNQNVTIDEHGEVVVIHSSEPGSIRITAPAPMRDPENN